MKTAVAGACSLIPGIGVAGARAEPGPQDKPQGSNLSGLSLSEASRLVRSKKVSPVELTQECLRRIDRLNPKLNAFITVTADPALAQAREAEKEIQQGLWSGPLHGIPIALKDLVDTAGVRTTAACGVFKDRIPSQDAEIVRRLKAAGAVLLGKLNLHECAYGGSSVVSYFGPVHNPWALEYMAGGSSAGSAAAVAAELCYMAIGSDTGGSIRQPAAYCGIVGLKPTYGRVSTRGVMPLAWSLDHLGPMTRTVMDAAVALQVIAGYDPEDTTSQDIPVPDYAATLTDGTSSLRIGVPHAHFYEKLHPEIQATIKTALSVLAGLASSPREVELPEVSDTAILVTKAEAFAFHRDYATRTPDLYQPETLKRIRAGADITAAAYIDARRQMAQFGRDAIKLFAAVDLLVTPTVPVPPFTVAELLAAADMRSKEVTTLRNTRPFNLMGLPTISVPCGFASKGFPVGMQISGPPGGEATVLRLAHAYEQATEWHKRRPNLS